MTIICSICINDINSNISTILSCGHVFHKHCIDSWIENSERHENRPTCPLCKTNIDPYMISPVYFSINDNVETEISSINDKIIIRDLRIKLDYMQSTHEELSLMLQEKQEKIGSLKADIKYRSTKEDKNNATMRYLKQLKRVADIDDYLSQPTTQAYLDSLSRTPRPELIVSLGGLKARCVRMARERDVALKKLEKAVIQKERMSMTIKSLTEELQRYKAKEGKSKTFSPNNFIQYGQPSTSRQVIVLDSDDDETCDSDNAQEIENVYNNEYEDANKNLCKSKQKDVQLESKYKSPSKNKQKYNYNALENEYATSINNELDNYHKNENLMFSSSDEGNSQVLFTLTNDNGQYSFTKP